MNTIVTNSPVTKLREIYNNLQNGWQVSHASLCKNLEEVLAGLEWQPLSTAPRDGTVVEFKGPSGYDVFQYRVMYAKYDSGYFDEIGEDEWNESSCWRTDGNVSVTDDGPMPTHWRPVS